MEEIILYADGFMKSKKEPSPGCSVAIYINNIKKYHIKLYINKLPSKYRKIFKKMPKTNNVSEYFALITALRMIKKISKLYTTDLHIYYVYMDSEVIIKQMNGDYTISSEHLSYLNKMAKNILLEIDNNENIKLVWIKRNKIVEVLGH